MRSARSYERQIDKLLAIIEKQNDRLMHLAGRTWEPPPLREAVEPDRDLEDLVAVPERYPDNEDWS